MIKNLVLSSGSIKGLSFIGAYKVLESNNLLNNVENVLSSSIGTVFGLCLCLGFTSEELDNIFKSIDLNLFNDINYEDLLGFLKYYGVYTCEKLIKILKAFIKAKMKQEDCTFKELYQYSNKNLIINSVCLNEQKLYNFSYLNYPDLSVLTAIEMSTAIPWLIRPILFEDKLFVDGALMNGYPINYFKDELDETLGIVLLEEGYQDKQLINNLEQYSLSIVMCQTMHQKKKMYQKYKDYTILVCVDDNNINKFDINKETINTVINAGYNCTENHLKDNFFDKYKKQNDSKSNPDTDIDIDIEVNTDLKINRDTNKNIDIKGNADDSEVLNKDLNKDKDKESKESKRQKDSLNLKQKKIKKI